MSPPKAIKIILSEMTKQEKKELKSKFNWDSITIAVYYAILDTLESDRLTGFEKNTLVCALITGYPSDNFRSLPVSEASEVFGWMNFLNTPPSISHPIGGFRKVRLGDRVLCVTPLEKLTVAQFTDWNVIASSGGDLKSNIDSLLSVFLVPEGYTYGEGYDIDQLKSAIRTLLPFTTAQSIINFLLTKYLRLLKRSLRYLEREMKKRNPENSELTQTLKKNLDQAMRFILTSFS